MNRFMKPVLLVLAVLVLASGVEILKELHQVQQRLDKQDAELARVAAGPRTEPSSPTKVEISVGAGWKSLGRDDAPITVVEFTDYECPFCKQFHTGTFVELKKDYIDPGKVRWVSLDLPLDMHPFARKAAEAVRCAGDQGKYWRMRDALLASAVPPSDEIIGRSAKGLSLNSGSLQACLDSKKYRVAVEDDMAEATRLQITHTPTFVVAKSTPDKLDGVVILGALPYATFQSTIDSLLKN